MCLTVQLFVCNYTHSFSCILHISLTTENEKQFGLAKGVTWVVFSIDVPHFHLSQYHRDSPYILLVNLPRCKYVHSHHQIVDLSISLYTLIWLTNLLQGLSFGLREEEVRDNSITDICSYEDEEVFPSKLVETVWSDLTDDYIVKPISSCWYSCTESTLIHRENLGLVDPRDWQSQLISG